MLRHQPPRRERRTRTRRIANWTNPTLRSSVPDRKSHTPEASHVPDYVAAPKVWGGKLHRYLAPTAWSGLTGHTCSLSSPFIIHSPVGTRTRRVGNWPHTPIWLKPETTDRGSKVLWPPGAQWVPLGVLFLFFILNCSPAQTSFSFCSAFFVSFPTSVLPSCLSS